MGKRVVKVNIRNCKRCGRLYTYNGIDLCPECYRQDEEDFVKIRDYIEMHPYATMIEISRETQVTVKKIMEFLKEGRLILNSDNTNIVLKCERCGKPISTGRFCDECKSNLGKELMKGYSVNNSTTHDNDRFYLHDRTKHKK